MNRGVKVAILAVVLVAMAAGVVFMVHYVPFDAASYAAWLGIGAAFAGLLSLAWPLRFLGIRTRRRALIVVFFGALVTVVAVLWPAAVVRSAEPHVRLDDFLPEYQFTEYHEGRARAPVEAVVEAVRTVTFADMPAAGLLMRLRKIAGGSFRSSPPAPRPILDLMLQPGTGFLALDLEDHTEIVCGMVGKPWSNEAPPPVSTPEAFIAFHAPGQIRVAFDIRVVDEGHGVTRVSTETRSLGNDARARRTFARYWRIIYPGSAIIRRAWLDAIIARAERGS